MGKEVCVGIWGFRRKLGDTFLLSPPTAVFPTIPPGAVRGAELLVSLSLDSDRDSIHSYHGRHHQEPCSGSLFLLFFHSRASQLLTTASEMDMAQILVLSLGKLKIHERQ